MTTEREIQAADRGAGLRILTGNVTSPTLASQIRSFLEMFPEARWHQFEPVARDNVQEGSRLALGGYFNTIYDIARADRILSLDSDFLACGPGHLRYAREWASRRSAESGSQKMNRVYAVESTLSNTGSVADHRLAMKAAQVELFARTVARKLGVAVEAPGDPGFPADWITALVNDLNSHRGAGLVIAGDQQAPEVHALAHAINQALGNTGRTVVYTDPVEAEPVLHNRSLLELIEDMQRGRVETILILGGNPVFAAPADFDFAAQLAKVRQRIHLSLYADETSRLCHWHVPMAHYLEAWSDTRAFDGTASIVQPLILPLYQGKTDHEILSTLMGRPEVPPYQTVRDYWSSRRQGAGFEEFWQVSLHDGVIERTALPPSQVSATIDPSRFKATAFVQQSRGDAALELVFRPDPTIFDGTFSNNGWLQELPKPLTKLTWSNAVLMSPRTAQLQGNLQPRDMVELHYRETVVRGPVWVAPGHADDSVTVHLGYGRTRAGQVGTGAGFNAYAIRMSDALWIGQGAALRRVEGSALLPCTQNHHTMEGRPLVRSGTIAEYERNPGFVREIHEDPPPELSLYPEWDYSQGYAWGMAINLGSCVGCSACVVACQAENNIPVVGPEQVARGREMHWLRIDRYHQGDVDNPSTHFQPVLCMHCEKAPCEVVCPVAATVHSSEGLNQMVYNRCVGTRYCSNNCPYKVRRFNFLQYSDWDTPSLKPLRNPDVSVRARGIMEKCTYCVQRINAARIEAEKANRPVRDGEIVTACQGACPTNAIVFGNINDASSRVAAMKRQPLNYGLLTELNTEPRTTYLARLRNPNPAIETE
jgi:molybdopterin-containing oxidoreductase family iron-sulfur binding subunit